MRQTFHIYQKMRKKIPHLLILILWALLEKVMDHNLWAISYGGKNCQLFDDERPSFMIVQSHRRQVLWPSSFLALEFRDRPVFWPSSFMSVPFLGCPVLLSSSFVTVQFHGRLVSWSSSLMTVQFHDCPVSLLSRVRPYQINFEPFYRCARFENAFQSFRL